MNAKTQINIFIVDDSKIFLLALKENIESAFKNIPIKIHAFETGEECMENILRIKPELVILDYNLSTKHPYASDGIEVLEWIKMESPQTNIIMLTSDEHVDIALKSFHQGASDYVIKTSDQFKKINRSITNVLTKYGYNVHKTDLIEETERELNENILRITMRINEQYPELSKYIEEMPESFSVNESADVTLKHLKAHYNSLTAMLNKYILEHRSNNAVKET